MKRNLLSLTVAALLCCTPFAASARDSVRAVAAQFDTPIVPSSLKFTPIKRADEDKKSRRESMFGVEKNLAGDNECLWQVLNIPVRIGALSNTKSSESDKYPNYVPEITFTVYLLIDPEKAADKDGKPLPEKKRPIMLQKEVTYVDIPLKKDKSTYLGDKQPGTATSINVAVFLSPADITRIVEDDKAEFYNPKPNDPANVKRQPNIKILAVAMGAKYKGANCWVKDRSARDEDITVTSTAKSWIADRWWTKFSSNTRGTQLRSINETPFASSYYPTYCATLPMYGNAGSSGSSSSLTDPLSPDSTPTGTTPADTGADTTTNTTDTEEPTSGTKSRRSRGSRN